MKSKSAFFGLLLAALVALPLYAQDEAAVIAKDYSATAMLYSQGREGDMQFHCTATAFERFEAATNGQAVRGYHFLTASHCVSNDDVAHERVEINPETFFLTFDERDNKQFLRVKVILAGYQHRGDDFAVLEVETDAKIPIVPLGDERRDYSGAQVFNIAAPMGLGKQIFHGWITMLKLDRPFVVDDINWRGGMLMQLPVAGGSSGSSVVSVRQQAIVGVIVGIIVPPSNGTPSFVAAPISRFQEFVALAQAGQYKWFVREGAPAAKP